MAAGRNVELMEKQVREFRPDFVCMQTPEAASDLKQRLADMEGIRVTCGMEGLLEVATHPQSQVLVTGIV